MIEEQVDVEILAFDFEVNLAADESEADAQLKQEFLDMVYEPLLQLPFAGVAGQREKIKGVRVLDGLMGKVGLRRRQRPLEIGNSLPLALKETRLDLVDQHGKTPAVLYGHLGVPETPSRVFKLLNKGDILPPR